MLLALTPAVLAAYMGVLILGWNLTDPAQRAAQSDGDRWFFRVWLGLIWLPFVLAGAVLLRRRERTAWADRLTAAAKWAGMAGLITLLCVSCSMGGI